MKVTIKLISILTLSQIFAAGCGGRLGFEGKKAESSSVMQEDTADIDAPVNAGLFIADTELEVDIKDVQGKSVSGATHYKTKDIKDGKLKVKRPGKANDGLVMVITGNSTNSCEIIVITMTLAGRDKQGAQLFKNLTIDRLTKDCQITDIKKGLAFELLDKNMGILKHAKYANITILKRYALPHYKEPMIDREGNPGVDYAKEGNAGFEYAKDGAKSEEQKVPTDEQKLADDVKTDIAKVEVSDTVDRKIDIAEAKQPQTADMPQRDIAPWAPPAMGFGFKPVFEANAEIEFKGDRAFIQAAKASAGALDQFYIVEIAVMDANKQVIAFGTRSFLGREVDVMLGVRISQVNELCGGGYGYGGMIGVADDVVDVKKPVASTKPNFGNKSAETAEANQTSFNLHCASPILPSPTGE